MTGWWAVPIVAVLCVLLVGMEVVVRRRHLPSDGSRRIAHVLACLTGIGVFLTAGPVLTAVLGAVFAVAMLVSRWVGALTSVHRVRRRSLGEVYLPLAIAVSAIVAASEPAVFVATMLVTGLADVAAGLVGDRLRAEQKTIWGSVAFGVVTAVVVGVIMPHPIWTPAVVVLATVVERVSRAGSDNLTVPVACLVPLMLQAHGVLAL